MGIIKVAIAEDDYRIAQLHEEYITRIDGMKVIGTGLNAHAMMELLQLHPVDLLLMDIYMPDRLGIDLLEEIREKYPLVDIILITAANEKDYLLKALKYGVISYLIKPVSLDVFIATLERYKEEKGKFASVTEVNQQVADYFFGRTQTDILHKQTGLPAGIDHVTLEKVRSILQKGGTGLTADKVGEKMGASRTTARRYLEYLVSINKAYVEQVYGVVGRPERNYFYR